MKKAELLKMLQDAKSDPSVLDGAIAKMSSTRGMVFTSENDVEGLESGKWYTLDENGDAVSVPSSKMRTDGRSAEFVPYYRTV